METLSKRTAGKIKLNFAKLRSKHLFIYTNFVATEKVDIAITFYTCIRYVLGSNLGKKISYPD
jgi:hypothetical protein